MERRRDGGGVVDGVAVDSTRRAGVCVDVEMALVAQACCCLVKHLHADPSLPASLPVAPCNACQPAASTGQTRREVYAGAVYGTRIIWAQLLHVPHHCHCLASDDAHPWIQNMQVNTAVNTGRLVAVHVTCDALAT